MITWSCLIECRSRGERIHDSPEGHFVACVVGVYAVFLVECQSWNPKLQCLDRRRRSGHELAGLRARKYFSRTIIFNVKLFALPQGPPWLRQKSLLNVPSPPFKQLRLQERDRRDEFALGVAHDTYPHARTYQKVAGEAVWNMNLTSILVVRKSGSPRSSLQANQAINCVKWCPY